MSPNPYADVIDIITTIEPNDYKKLVVIIAKSNPSVLIKACKRLGIVYKDTDCQYENEPWFKEVIALLRQNKIVYAVKEIREKTGKGLKESKDMMDKIRIDCKDIIAYGRL